MPDIPFRTGRHSSQLAVISFFVGLTLTLPTIGAGGSTIWVPPPNATDDTANIQAALNACVAQGPGCTVQLQAGKYFTRQLVTYNFQGTFKGMGMSSTTIEALPNLLVEIEPVGGVSESLCQPNTTTCLWPDLILFVNGDIHVSDLSIFEKARPGTATTPWNFAGGGPFIGLFDALTFMGQHANAYVDRIHIEGLLDTTGATGLGGFNIVNGVHFTGEFPHSPTPWDWYFLSGSYIVQNSSFKTMFDGISQDSFVRSTRITVGGSPTTGNHLEDLVAGIDMETLEDSLVEISYNESSGIFAGMWIVPWQLAHFVPASPSRYLIHDNKFLATGQSADPIYLFDYLPKPWIQATIWDNTVEPQNSLSEGIGINNTKGTVTWNNSITGSDGLDAIGLYSSTLATVIRNNVSGFTVDTTVGNAEIFLDPSTSHGLVVCAESSDTVLNQGTNNTVIGCQQPITATGSADPATVRPRPNLPKIKPFGFLLPGKEPTAEVDLGEANFIGSRTNQGFVG